MAPKKKAKHPVLSAATKLMFVLLFIPIALTGYVLYQVFSTDEKPQTSTGELTIPTEYIPIYMAASEAFNVPWTLLAAHHRIETRFSTMSTLVSPAGAEGHMQFMPCTFVGWRHPTCSGLGEGAIQEEEKTNLAVIEKYGGYGVDGDGDGIADPFNIYDAIYSAAKFLSKYGAATGDLKKAIFQYNHSDDYVEDVYYFYELYTSQQDELEQSAYAQ